MAKPQDLTVTVIQPQRRTTGWRTLIAVFAATSALGGCVVADEGDAETLSTSGQLATGSGSGSGSAATEVCCSIHWQKAQMCTTDSSGTPVLTTTTSGPLMIYESDECEDSYSSIYMGSASANRCVNSAAADVQPWALQPATQPYDYKSFFYGRFLFMVPNTVEGATRCRGAVDGYQVGLTRGDFNLK
ncbi:MAG: hypothetical protein H0T42_09260 [Deltaproteobacteria bacterium]|nr:hypothetical protein [Deltaproteobacteria bacterium]